MAMATQRPPFFVSFFGAFRARTNPTFQAKSSAPAASLSSSMTATAHGSSNSNNGSIPSSRSITTSSTGEAINSSQAYQTSNSQSTPLSAANKPSNPFSATAFTSTSPGTHHNHSPFYSPRSPGTSSPTANSHGSTLPLTRGRQRRGSDSSNSSGGFMEALGGANEKWYIGGRTAGGDERFYRLGLVTAGGSGTSGRATSLDRLSL